jgi:hypothetical protein
MPSRIVALAVMLAMVQLSARAADLVKWSVKGAYSRRMRRSGRLSPRSSRRRASGSSSFSWAHGVRRQAPAAIAVGRPPDIAFGVNIDTSISQRAFHDRLDGLTDTI